MALEAGDYAAARWHWERIIPVAVPPDQPRTLAGLSRHDARPGDGAGAAGVGFDLGRRRRSGAGGAGRVGPPAPRGARPPGRPGGRILPKRWAKLIAQSAPGRSRRSRPIGRPLPATPARDKIAPRRRRRGRMAWRMPLSEGPSAAAAPAKQDFAPADALSCLSAAGGRPRVRQRSGRRLRPFGCPTGGRLWGETTPTVFRDPMQGIVAALSIPAGHLGRASIHHDRLRRPALRPHGKPRHQSPAAALVGLGSSYLVCLDLEAEGKLSGRPRPKRAGPSRARRWPTRRACMSAMRRNDIRPQAHVACFDPQTGRLRWRRFVCAAETPGPRHCSRNARTTCSRSTARRSTTTPTSAPWRPSPRRRGGCAGSACIRARGTATCCGRQPHWQRDLTPCLYHGGTLLVAPADSPLSSPSTPAPAKCSGESTWKTRRNCWAWPAIA